MKLEDFETGEEIDSEEECVIIRDDYSQDEIYLKGSNFPETARKQLIHEQIPESDKTLPNAEERFYHVEIRRVLHSRGSYLQGKTLKQFAPKTLEFFSEEKDMLEALDAIDYAF